ncbi:MAG: tyrosine-type recombinase/integrase [Prevotella sp.]|nr:tyrosine-type recombinase/integrase [Prevotella sp.]
MEMLNNAKVSFNFNLREKTKKTATQIYCVVRVNKRQIKIPLGLKVNPWQWNKQKQICLIGGNMMDAEMENNINANRKINEMRCKFDDIILYICGGSVTETTEIEGYIKKELNIFTEQTNNKIMANYNAIPPKRTITATTLLKKAFAIYYDGAKESTTHTQNVRLQTFFNYIKETNKYDTPKLLTQEGLNDYKEYLMNGEVKRSANVINQLCQLIARLINDILSVNNEFRRYKIGMVRYVNIDDKRRHDETKKRALTENEINAIVNCDTLTEKEKEFRDVFVLQLNCGLREGDLHKMFNGDYKTQQIKGITTYIVNTQKEGITAVIIANETITSIQNKYKNGFKFVKFGKSFNATYNQALKQICKKASLTSEEVYYIDVAGKKVKKTNKLCDIISNHFARHTFVTLKLREGYNAEEVSKMTGHADERMINEIYQHLTEEDKANKVIAAQKRISSAKGNETISNDSVIVQQAKQNFILQKENEITNFLKNLYSKEHEIKGNIMFYCSTMEIKNCGADMEKAFNLLFGGFPNMQERELIYNGADCLDLVNLRLRKYGYKLTENFELEPNY